MAKKDKKKAAAGDEVNLVDMLTFNLAIACKYMGLPNHDSLEKALRPTDDDGEISTLAQICFSELLGPGHTRALCCALLARGTGMRPHPMAPLKSLQLWGCGIGDAGTASVAQLLLLGPRVELNMTHLELMDNRVGPAGCRALGDALLLGGNASLLTLRLDLNGGIGDEGIVELCKGLRSNRTLTRLTVAYCGLGERGAQALAEVLATPTCGLKSIDIRGNALGSVGLRTLAVAAAGNKVLEELILADNGIGAGTDEENEAAMSDLGQALSSPPEVCALSKVDLHMNPLGEVMGRVLMPFVTPENKKLKTLLVDSSLPTDVFAALLRMDTGGGKKKKGKGKKKKKK